MIRKALIIILFMFCQNIYSQTPDWVVDENKFENTMTLVAFLNIQGETLKSKNDLVGAFVNGECRGVTNLIYVTNKDRFYAYLTIFSNSTDEEIKFKVYDSSSNQISNIGQTILFKTNGHLGDLSQAFSIAFPALNNKAEINSFNFQGVDKDFITISDGSIIVNSIIDANVSSLIAFYELSTGATLFIDSEKYESGMLLNNFRYITNLKVLSEDESVLKTWNIVFSSGGGSSIFLKKDAVCYSGGAIKVQYSTNDVEVKLFMAEELITTQTIINGETIFDNLATGEYNVNVNNENKTIIINLKQ